MKMNKKKVFVLALAVCMFATLSMGSLAYFSDEDTVTNKFMIAGSEDGNPDEVFSVDVWEYTPDSYKDTDGDGNPDMTKEQEGYEYENILPGDSLTKEVNVENTGAYDQYIRLIVVVSDATQWQAALDVTGTPELSAIVSGFDSTKWAHIGPNYDAENNNFYYVLYGAKALGVGETVEVFKTVEVPVTLTREQAATFTGGFEVKVLAEAVQTENVGADAYEAFKTVGLDATASYTEFVTNP